MKVILLKDVSKLGKKYEVKEVSSGHAQNLLIPRGDAVAATPQALKRAELERSANEGERKIQEELLAKNIEELDGLTLTIKGKANDKGHLFAGLHREAISAELKEQSRLDVMPEAIELDQPIKEVGEHTISVKAGGKSAKFKVVVEAK